MSQNFLIWKQEKLRRELRDVRSQLSTLRLEVDAACESLGEEDAAEIRSHIWPDGKKEAQLDKSIADIGLSSRVYRRLTYVGIDSLRDLVVNTREELGGIPYLGKIGIDEIERVLENLGLKLRDG